MNQTILTLIALQEIDNKISAWQETLALVPVKLAEARKKLDDLDERVAETENTLKANASKRRELEGESADLANRKSLNQTRQLKAKSNDEYRAVLKEAEHITQQISLKDDELLNLMEQSDQLETLLPELLSERDSELTLYEQEAKNIESTLEDGHRLEAENKIKREALTADLPPETLLRYQTISRNRGSQVVAPVVDGLCQVCRLSVPPQIFNELQRNDKIMGCPNCGRIIYWRDHPDISPKTDKANPSTPEQVSHA